MGPRGPSKRGLFVDFFSCYDLSSISALHRRVIKLKVFNLKSEALLTHITMFAGQWNFLNYGYFLLNSDKNGKVRVVENFPQLLRLRVRQSGFSKRKKIQETSSNRGSMALIKKFFRSVFIILLNFGCNKSLRIVAITWYSTYFENMTKGRRCGSAIQRSRSQHPRSTPPKQSDVH